MEDRVAFAGSAEANWNDFLRNLKKRNPLGLSQCVLYFLTVFWGLLITIPFGITLRDFDHRCILFAGIVWNNSVIWPWMENSCEFVLYVSLAVCFFYGISMAVFTLLAVLPRSNIRYESFSYIQTANVMYVLRSLNPVFVLVNFGICCLMLSVAIVLTAGFSKFCQSAMSHFREDGYDIRTCIDVQHVDWTKYPIEGGRDDGPRGFRFNTCLSIAVVGAWGAFVTWVLQLILNLSLLCTGCTCMVAEEKQQTNKSMLIAARRSRMATPIGTPGHMTPRPFPPGMMYGQQPQGPQSQYSTSRGPPSVSGPPSQYSRGPSQYHYGPQQGRSGPPSQHSHGPPAQYGHPGHPANPYREGPPGGHYGPVLPPVGQSKA